MEGKVMQKNSGSGIAKKIPYRAVLIYGIVLLIYIFPLGMIANQQPLMLEPVSTGLHISRALYSSLDALTQTMNLIGSLFVPLLVIKVGTSNIVRLGVVTPIVYCFCMWAAGSINGLSLPATAALIGIGQGALGLTCTWCNVLTISVLINNWFARNRGLMIGIATSTGSASGTVFATLVASWIANSGWQSSLLIRGFISIAIAIVVIIFVKAKPAPGEARIWESKANDAELTKKREEETEVGLTLKEARKTARFYLMILFFFIAGGGAYASVNVLSAYAVDTGHAALTGLVLSIVYITSMIVTIPICGLLEKFGGRKVLTPLLVVQVIGLFILSQKQVGSGFLIFAAFLLGCAYIIIMGVIPIITREIFGDKEFVRVQSFIFSGMIVGFIVLYPAANFVYHFFGSYRHYYFISAFSYIAAIVILFYFTQNKFRVLYNHQKEMKKKAQEAKKQIDEAQA